MSEGGLEKSLPEQYDEAGHNDHDHWLMAITTMMMMLMLTMMMLLMVMLIRVG